MALLRNHLALIAAMLLMAIAKGSQANEQQQNGEQGSDSKSDQKEEKGSVDIARFYANDSLIWILGIGNSLYPCKLDIVEYTNESETLFARFHHDGSRFQRKYLKGIFKTVSTEKENMYEPVSTSNGNLYNAMEVSPRNENRRRHSNSGSWRSTEIMLYESSNGSCALFAIKYSEQPMRPIVNGVRGRPPMPTTGTMTTVEYDIRIKNTIAGNEEEGTCVEELKKHFQALAEENKDVQLPGSSETCKQNCKEDPTCNSPLQVKQSENSS